jgi:hypothetical protein
MEEVALCPVAPFDRSVSVADDASKWTTRRKTLSIAAEKERPQSGREADADGEANPLEREGTETRD